MEISPSNINQPVSFYPKSTGNNINMVPEGENRLYGTSLFMSNTLINEVKKVTNSPVKKKRKSKRLNTMDFEYLPDEAFEASALSENPENFFIEENENKIAENIKKAWTFFYEKTPLVNYSFLKNKTKKIQHAVETLNDITQDVDEMLNTAVPYGENQEVYNKIAKNLVDAAGIIGKANKDF